MNVTGSVTKSSQKIDIVLKFIKYLTINALIWLQSQVKVTRVTITLVKVKVSPSHITRVKVLKYLVLKLLSSVVNSNLKSYFDEYADIVLHYYFGNVSDNNTFTWLSKVQVKVT